jgi:protocatechuate 3,4-dioxygenase, beta subunit
VDRAERRDRWWLGGVDRRAFVLGAAASVTILAVPGRTPAATALTPTPRQTSGPFYPTSLPLDADADLVSVAGRAERAAGVVTFVSGRVLAADGRPMRGVRIEIWQCDAFGRYHHPRAGGEADPNFQGYGSTTADGYGGYRFRTIRPTPYPGRTPHIHFAVSGEGVQRFTTQMYVEGEPLNDTDFLLSRIRDPQARARVVVPLRAADAVEPGALSADFDIVLGDA